MKTAARDSFWLHLTLLAAVCLRVAASPNITHCSPLALVPGNRTVLTFSGSALQNVSNLWLSAGGSAKRINSPNAESVVFEVTCPDQARGVQAVQLFGPDGASNFRLVMVDALPTAPHGAQHHARTNAHRITVPAAVDCVAETEKVDYYNFSAKAGEKVSIEVIAQRIGSEMDPVVQVLDAAGQELMVCDDEPGVWRDARFVFVSPAVGDYTLAVHDTAYGGGSNYHYRLRVTHEPLVWFTYPLIDPREVGVAFQRVGAGEFAESVGSPANPAWTARFSAASEMVEIEPNDSNVCAQAISVPMIVNGRIDRPNDLDCFRFVASKDESVIFESATRSLGSPCDLVLAIKTMGGQVVARSDSNLPGDAAVTNKFSESGEYVLEVRELSGTAIPGVPYRIRVQRFQGGVELSAEENRLEGLVGGTVTLKLKYQRHGYVGPVHFELWPAIHGLTLEENAEFAESTTEGELKLKVSEPLAGGGLAHFKIRAFGPSGSIGVVSTGPALHKEFPLMLITPAMLDDLFSVAVRTQ